MDPSVGLHQAPEPGGFAALAGLCKRVSRWGCAWGGGTGQHPPPQVWQGAGTGSGTGLCPPAPRGSGCCRGSGEDAGLGQLQGKVQGFLRHNFYQEKKKTHKLLEVVTACKSQIYIFVG